MDITTEWLHIRDLEREDLDSMVALWTDPIVKREMGTYGPQVSEEVLPWIEDAISHNRAVPRFAHNSAIVESSSGLVTGWIGFGKPSKPGIGDLDFGYSVLPEFRGRGYATEALSAVIEFCFAEVGANSVFGETMPANVASARVMEKVGMQRAGVSEDGHIVFRIERGAPDSHQERHLGVHSTDPA